MQSQARLSDLIILQLNVYFDLLLSAASLKIVQQKSGNNNICTFCSTLFPVTSSNRNYFLTFEWGFFSFRISGSSHLHADSLWQQAEIMK